MMAIFSSKPPLLGHLRGDVAGLCVQVLMGDEALDLVDGDGLVDAAAGAGVLAAAVADAAADGRERVFVLDERKSVGVAPLAASFRYPCTAIWAGQAVLQGAVPAS